MKYYCLKCEVELPASKIRGLFYCTVCDIHYVKLKNELHQISYNTYDRMEGFIQKRL